MRGMNGMNFHSSGMILNVSECGERQFHDVINCIRIMSIHISCDMYLRLGLHVQIRLYYVLPYKAKISAQHGIGFILDRCIVSLGLTMPNLQKKRLLIFEIFNIKKCTLFFWNRVYLCIHHIHFVVNPLTTDRDRYRLPRALSSIFTEQPSKFKGLKKNDFCIFSCLTISLPLRAKAFFSVALSKP